MFKFVLILSMTVVSLVWCKAEQDDATLAELEEVDVDQILKSERLVKNYMNCFMDRGKCTPLGKSVKDNLAEGLKTGCPQCTPKIKEMSLKIFKELIENRKEWFAELEKKYDPTGEYRKRYAAQFKAKGLIV